MVRVPIFFGSSVTVCVSTLTTYLENMCKKLFIKSEDSLHTFLQTYTKASSFGLNQTIDTTSQPFQTTEKEPGFDGGSFSGSIFIGFTYVIMVCGFALELIYDREVCTHNSQK